MVFFMLKPYQRVFQNNWKIFVFWLQINLSLLEIGEGSLILVFLFVAEAVKHSQKDNFTLIKCLKSYLVDKKIENEKRKKERKRMLHKLLIFNFYTLSIRKNI